MTAVLPGGVSAPADGRRTRGYEFMGAAPRRGNERIMEKKQNDNAQKQKKEQERPVTRAEKAGRMKAILRELLTERNYRWNEILDVSAKVYVEKYPGETDDLNDLKGKFGSVFSLMEDAGEMRFQAGVCSLVQTGKAEEKAPVKTPEKSPEKALSKAPAKEEKKSEKAEKVSEKTAEESEKPVGTEAKTQEKPAGKSGAGTRKRSARKSAAETKAEANQVPASASAPEGAAPVLSAEKPENRPAEGEKAAVQPAEPVKSAEKAGSEASVSEKPAPAKRGRKPRTASASAAPAEQTPAETATEEAEEKAPARKRGRKPKAAESGKSGEIKTQTAQITQTSQTPQTAEKAEIPAEKTATTEGAAAAKAEVSGTADRAVTEKKTDGEVGAALPAGEKEAGKEDAAAPSEPAEAVKPVGEKADSGKQEMAENAGEAAEKQPETEKAAEKQPAEVKQAEKIAEQTGVPAVRPEAKVAPVFDMTLLFGGTAKKPAKTPVGGREERRPARAEQAVAEKAQAPGTAEEKGKEKVGEGRGTAAVEKEPVRRSDKPAVRAAMPEFAFLGNAAAREKSGAQMSGAQGVRTAERPVKTGAKAEEKEGAGTPVRSERQGASASVQPIARPRNSAAAAGRQTAKEAGQVSGNGANVSANAAGNAAVSAPVGGNAGGGGTNGNNGNSGNRRGRRGGRGRAPQVPETPEDALKAEFLKRLRSLGGDYFEYYSVYLLERYSLRNGRRLEGLRVSGGEHDGGIDGEIELTDKFGFRETIYIQAKNWDPSKGDLDKWVVGETLLQQFIGAVTCRLAKEGKQHGRGIFVTTSRFTPEARELLETMSDRFVGYDADDVFEAAKECSFGLVQKNGEWVPDEELLSGGKAFFNMF